jgi:phospholipid/cholesterol/gamma-HCH transport system ATP-binding protein
MKRKLISSFALEDMTFAYPGSEPLFENITIEIPKTKAVWIRSPGGRGKSTLLRLLFGLVSPASGKLLINGTNVSDLSFEEFLEYRLSMGYGFDIGGLLNNKSIFENLILPLQYHKLISDEEAAERVSQTIDMFGMTMSRDLRPFAVPGSVRKLACILRAFVHWPQVVFLDDPLTGLKSDNVNDLIYYVEESFATRGLQQVFFTSESPLLADKFKAEELLISTDWFTTRAVA